MTLAHPNKSHTKPSTYEAMEESLAILDKSKTPMSVREIVSLSRFDQEQIRLALRKLKAAGKIMPAPLRKWSSATKKATL